MNHDYEHCADYVKGKCPLSCFRAELVEDYRQLAASREWVRPVSWMNLKDTDSCPMKRRKK